MKAIINGLNGLCVCILIYFSQYGKNKLVCRHYITFILYLWGCRLNKHYSDSDMN